MADITTISDRALFSTAGAIFALAIRRLLCYLWHRYWPL